MDHAELIRRLRKLSKAITKNIDCPNSGGCGVIAGIVGFELRQLGVMVEVVTPVDEYYSKPASLVRSNVKNKNDAREWSDNGLNRYHLAIRFRSNGRCYTWDSDGLIQSSSRFGKDHGCFTSSKFGDGLSVDECLAMSSSPKGWNSSFDRKQIPKIRHLVKHYISYGFD